MRTEKNILRTIDPKVLPTHFEAARVEEYWDQQWDTWGVYHYDPARPREETFVVDTPPPTVSGSLHVGHVFSYTQTDIIVRYRRMSGRNIFYPMGWDDNGLPTERRVQNYFHIRCDPHAPFEPGLKIKLPIEEKRNQPPRIVSRPNFIELCLQLTREDERIFKSLWRHVGLSVDWQQEYSTIDHISRYIAQFSFLDLYKKGHIYSIDAPTMWDVDFQTAVAQAETEDRMLPGFLYYIRFGIEGSDQSFVIATTRPEFLPACVGVTAHPDDVRYKDLFGKRAITPLFQVSVPIFPSELVETEKGTGVLMVCTFGDATDVLWWRESKLPLRQIIGRDGRLAPIVFGSEGFESHNPDAANCYYEQLVGKTLEETRKSIVEMLRDPADSLGGLQAPLVGDPKPIEHAVKFFEKGDRPLEFIPTRQWFVRLLNKKEQLLAIGDRISWHPDHMRLRYRNWIENLQFDWCISRQRYFGVPFPVWYPVDEREMPVLDKPILAEADRLPVDPMTDTAPGYGESQHNMPEGFTGESDVLDTWFTSSMTPQIASRWLLDPSRHKELFPMDLRPQSHEIIRTWAFYTIVKALLHENTIPWNHIAISGWILDPDRKKMSKSKGNVLTPVYLIEKYGADVVRYWAANARLGVDTAFDENILKIGRRLVIKIFNASKFVLAQTSAVYPITYELDCAFLQKLQQLVWQSTDLFEKIEYASALREIEKFFWTCFTDTFLELVKLRARNNENEFGRGSSVMALRLGLNVLLRLFAPFLPYITEEVWSWAFAEETEYQSIHQAPWPSNADFVVIEQPADIETFDVAVACLSKINKCKSESGVSIGRTIQQLIIAANGATADKLRCAVSDVMAAARAVNYSIMENENLDKGIFEIIEARFVENT